MLTDVTDELMQLAHKDFSKRMPEFFAPISSARPRLLLKLQMWGYPVLSFIGLSRKRSFATIRRAIDFELGLLRAHRALEITLGPLILATSVSVVSHGLVGPLEVVRGFGTLISVGRFGSRAKLWHCV